MMKIKVGINGYGRIGRNVLRALIESKKHKHIEVVAVNDLGNLEVNAELTKRDSVHGPLAADVSVDGNYLVINGKHIRFTAERNPKNCLWGELGVDVVAECTGFFASKEEASAHLEAGAKKVLISAPAGSDIPTIVYGVNDSTLRASDRIVSNASCTTNCLAPVAKVLNELAGIQSGLMTTVHAFTNDQNLADGFHSDIRRARAASLSMIPTKTGAAAAVGLVLPELAGKLDGYAIRVPTPNVSVVDLTVLLKQNVSIEAVNEAMIAASKGELAGILEVNSAPLVSIDFNHNPASSTFDLTQTRQCGDLLKVVAWYDNEWGFSNRMLDTLTAMMKAK
jgi:glyceraldehyde 3-phosphate dehydrogenase